MTDVNTYKLQTNSFDDFDEHLNKSNNIFLSAPFGLGKTTFIKDYIDSKKSENKYNFFHLYPVHYAVNKNEDVFELIKYDLLFELLKNDKSNAETKINLNKGVKDIVKKNAHTILLSFIEKIPEIGKPLKEIIEVLEKTENDIIELFQTDFQTPELNTFIKKIESSKGSVFEYDIITKYINNKLEEVKNGNSDKKNVLILDDLDRIEPNHLFRLLNVFSANFDNSDYSINKFGIDKVIIVADYHNIKSIYHHKYGNESDFEGYINKFYLDEIYFLTFYDTIKKLFEKNYNISEYGYPEGPILKINLLTLLFNNKQVNFRQIKKAPKINFHSERNLIEVVNDLVKIFNNDFKDLVRSFGLVSPENDPAIGEVFWSRLMQYIIDFYYSNGEIRILEKHEHSGTPYLVFKLIDGEKEQKFDLKSSDKINIEPYINLNIINKSIIWKEFLAFLKYKYQTRND